MEKRTAIAIVATIKREAVMPVFNRNCTVCCEGTFRYAGSSPAPEGGRNYHAECGQCGALHNGWSPQVTPRAVTWLRNTIGPEQREAARRAYYRVPGDRKTKQAPAWHRWKEVVRAA